MSHGRAELAALPGPSDPPTGGDNVRARVKKAPTAFRTISEVAEELGVHQHVLRFWETKFTQIRPLKRGGGRRYYRPDDIALLRRISDLLYVQGFTIKGVQRLLREGGGRLSDDIPPPLDEDRDDSERDPAREPELPLSPGLSAGSGRVAPGMGGGLGNGPGASTEAARMRLLLAEVLAELEALRALLP